MGQFVLVFKDDNVKEPVTITQEGKLRLMLNDMKDSKEAVD